MLQYAAKGKGMKKSTMSIMNSLVNDIFEKLCIEAGSAVKYHKDLALTSREVQTAVRLLLPGGLGKNAER